MSEETVSRIISLTTSVLMCANEWERTGVSCAQSIKQASIEIRDLVSGLSLNDPNFNLAAIANSLPSRDVAAIMTDADAQAYAEQIGISPEGVTVANLGDRLTTAEHDDYCRSLGLDLTATWTQIRTALREKSQE